MGMAIQTLFFTETYKKSRYDLGIFGGTAMECLSRCRWCIRFFFSKGMIGPELTFLLAGLLPLWRVNFKMPDIVERHDGPAVIFPDQLVEGGPFPFVPPFIGGLLNHVVDEHFRRAAVRNNKHAATRVSFGDLAHHLDHPCLHVVLCLEGPRIRQ